MIRLLSILSTVFALSLFASPAHANNVTQFGAGAHYWVTLDDVDLDDVDEDGIGWYISWRSQADDVAAIGLDIEWLPADILGIDGDVIAPQAYFLVGGALYFGAGIGAYYIEEDSDWVDDPFYVLRAGLDLELIPGLHIDVNVNYRFDDWENVGDELDDVDTDTLTAGVALRIEV